MTISALLSELNDSQRSAATFPREHALVLAGAGCGKTKTIVARAAYLIANGTPANRIQILTFTRRSASEIVARVKTHLGDAATGLHASTFHTWCMSLIRRAPAAFGCKDFTVIDRDDQLQLYRVLRGKGAAKQFATAAKLCDMYSYARNTGMTLDATLQKNYPEYVDQRDAIGRVMMAYEQKKRTRRYMDYDDILEIVARRIATSPEVCGWVAAQFDHILVDEMQDTNPLQWKLLDPLKHCVTLFCVGDDAQSIYGFRGADFRNVHSFSERVPNSTTLRLERNYRSTQEILDCSNWLLAQSPLEYNKKLDAARGSGSRPHLHTFVNEWEEARWIAEDLEFRRNAGATWREHMVLVRSSNAARVIEGALLAKDIPYVFIGGTKLMDSAHVRDVLSVLRIVGNPQDEIGWMRFLTLFNGVGEMTANRAIERVLESASLDACLDALRLETKIPAAAAETIEIVRNCHMEVGKAIATATRALESLLREKYQKQDWDKRRRDFQLVEKLAQRHTSILGFIEEYLLDPVHGSMVDRLENDDAVTLITIHSAKGTEREVCYVVNVSPGAYPMQYAVGNVEDVEEERRVLYVALTRAKNELIVTRHGYCFWAAATSPTSPDEEEAESYFFHELPDLLFEQTDHERPAWTPQVAAPAVAGVADLGIGISLGFDLGATS